MKKSLILLLLALLALGLLALALLERRGFRANAPVPHWEAAIAQRLRNTSIPRTERERKNPAASSLAFLRDGRDSFLAHCAICHGVDGSGKTPVGTNLYPRVPDLRSPQTQRLSDGEIHYIIENGVQLTGMPAWSNSGSSDDVWKLVVFVRSLGPGTAARAQESASMASAHYAGSQACGKCHQEIYARWKKTPMANVVRDPREHPEAITPNLATNNVAKFTKDQVALVYGSLWKQRYFSKVGDDYFPLPAQWVFADHSWRPYHVPDKGGDWWTAYYPPDNMQRPTGPTCDGCHSVAYDIHTKQVAEWNVGCERCHGAGSEHVAHPTRDNILNPGRLDPVDDTDTCVQCHSQGQPRSSPIEGKYYDWPVGYNVGLRLADYWKLEGCRLGQTNFYYFPDCTAHKNRMQGNDFVQSVMYHRGITCASCHDVHGTDNYAQLRKPADQICLDCHGPSSPNGPHTATLDEHTHHKAGGTGSQCVACHMPAIETEGVPATFVHAHTFRFITPEMTDKYGIPNPCTSCHKDKNTGWATEMMNGWQNYSPWRATLE